MYMRAIEDAILMDIFPGCKQIELLLTGSYCIWFVSLARQAREII